MSIIIKTLLGEDLRPYIPALAQLRLSIFRDYPYLYEGTLEYEEAYLRTYSQSQSSIFILALDENQVVGVSTAIPMLEADAAFQKPFLAEAYDIKQILYFGESVLQPSYRGQGIGHEFFNAREKYAQGMGSHYTCFCAVERPTTHPLKPDNYQPLDMFWHKRGYSKQSQLKTEYEWQDISETSASYKTMVFWLKAWK